MKSGQSLIIVCLMYYDLSIINQHTKYIDRYQFDIYCCYKEFYFYIFNQSPLSYTSIGTLSNLFFTCISYFLCHYIFCLSISSSIFLFKFFSFTLIFIAILTTFELVITYHNMTKPTQYIFLYFINNLCYSCITL